MQSLKNQAKRLFSAQKNLHIHALAQSHTQLVRDGKQPAAALWAQGASPPAVPQKARFASCYPVAHRPSGLHRVSYCPRRCALLGGPSPTVIPKERMKSVSHLLPARTSPLRHRLRLPLVGLALLGGALLQGCAVMSPEECAQADWYALGHEDGAQGRDRTYLQERVSECAKAQVAADTGRYAQGYAQGLQQYCVVDNAFALGTRGGQYQGVCPGAIDLEFRRRFDAGRAVYDARQEVQRLHTRINDKERELTRTLEDEERSLRTPKSADERRRIQRDFEQRRQRLRSEIRQLDRQLHRARDQQYEAERQGQ